MVRLVSLALLASMLALNSCSCQKSLHAPKIEGSSTVFVLSEAVAEEYQIANNLGLSIGASGTGGGFKKLCSKRVTLIGASRKVTASELALCNENGVTLKEIPVALDGIVVAVHRDNHFLDSLSVSTLKKIFEPKAEGNIMRWSDVDPRWPNTKIALFGPGTSSGTYDYFTKAIVGSQHASRGDITTSEDDNVIVYGVKTTKDSLGFFSLAYYLENQASLKAVAIVDDRNEGARAVLPSVVNVQNGTYRPFTRMVYLYVSTALNAADKDVLTFYLHNCRRLALDVGLVPLDDEHYRMALQTLEEI